MYPIRTKWSGPVLLHIGLWALLALALITLATPEIVFQIRRGHFGPVDPQHSIVRYMWGLNGSAHATEVQRELAALPRGRSIILLMSEKGESQMAGLGMSYMAWPRPVQMLFFNDSATEAKVKALNPDTVGAIILCNTRPPQWLVDFNPPEHGLLITSFVTVGERP